MTDKIDIAPYKGAAGGWGSARAVGAILVDERAAAAPATLLRQNKPRGFACVSCAWAKPAEPHPLEFCENGAKATAWETTPKRADAAFFERHTLADLATWSDHALEATGRLTQPLRWDAGVDKYRPVSWEDAFREIGAELRAQAPADVVFYTSGRASLEASYMYQLFARIYGSNNLPDSSNMCHESTSVALPKTIGVPVGTIRLEDFEHTDCIFFFGQNVGTSSPRMLHDLQQASERGVPIVCFNPLRERGLEWFKNPQSPGEMLTRKATQIASQYHQLKAGGDIAAILGMCKALIAADDHAQAQGQPRVLDADFIAQHTHGFESFADVARNTGWQVLEQRSGLTRGAMEAAARVYAGAQAVMGIYGMGLTQHAEGVENVHMVTNLLLLRGNIGKPGAGVCPVRGHSNVQGQRTVGITEKPELAPLDRLAELYAFEPPREEGLATVPACTAILEGRVHAFVALGGNFLRAVPDTSRIEPAWRKLRLTVQIATKLNRSHVVHGEIAYLLPCLGRSEHDAQRNGPQAVTMEDSTACIHGSLGRHKPASPGLMSEPAIIAALARVTVPDQSQVPWEEWVADYRRIRDAIEQTYPDTFTRFNERMWQPGGFPRPLPARERRWETQTGRANFIAPKSLTAGLDTDPQARDILQLLTLRSNDQFNTTVYGYDDRFRGIKGTRDVVLLNRNDADRLGLQNGDTVTLRTAVDEGIERALPGLRVVLYNIPEGCCAGYYPECNVLLPLWHHAHESLVPAAKAIPVRLQRTAQARPGAALGKAGAARMHIRRVA